jgi:hypothetical protein
MGSFNTTIYETIEVFHPEFTDGIAEMEIEFEVEVYHEPEDKSVGIFGHTLVAENYKVVEIVLHDGDKKYTISEDLATQLVPEDEWQRLTDKAQKSAEDHDQYVGVDDY